MELILNFTIIGDPAFDFFFSLVFSISLTIWLMTSFFYVFKGRL